VSSANRLYRSIQRFRSGSDTRPDPGERGYRERIPIPIAGEEDASSPTVEGRRKARQTRREARKGEATPTPEAKPTPTPKQ
jgi:hypothetical protein